MSMARLRSSWTPVGPYCRTQLLHPLCQTQESQRSRRPGCKVRHRARAACTPRFVVRTPECAFVSARQVVHVCMLKLKRVRASMRVCMPACVCACVPVPVPVRMRICALCCSRLGSTCSALRQAYPKHCVRMEPLNCCISWGSTLNKTAGPPRTASGGSHTTWHAATRLPADATIRRDERPLVRRQTQPCDSARRHCFSMECDYVACLPSPPSPVPRFAPR